jgi:toxin FitB
MLLDTNILIYAAHPSYAALRTFLESKEAELCVSAISKVETLGYPKLTFTEKRMLQSFFDTILVLPVSDEVIDKAIVLKQMRKIALGDALIAATALVHRQPLLTKNVSDFDKIIGLTVISMDSI